MKTIAFVTTSKGRLHHIKQTLPLMVAQAPSEIVVVDYGCPDRTGDWVEANYPAVRVVRIDDDPGFCVARARNLGAGASGSDWLAFIDGDIKVAAGWVDWMQQELEPGHFYRAAPRGGKRDPETFGTVICARTDFEAIGGFDEAYEGWGGTDADLYHNLTRHGCTDRDYPAEFVDAIRHGDDERSGMSGLNRHQHIIVSRCYRLAKEQAMKIAGTRAPLPIETRKALLANTQERLMRWFEAGSAKPIALRYVLSKRRSLGMPADYTGESELAFTIRLGRRRALAEDP